MIIDADSKPEIGFCLHTLVFAHFKNSDSYEKESMHTYIAIHN